MAEPRPVAHATGATRERAFAFDKRDFNRVCKLIYVHAGIQLNAHKADMVYGRLVRRLRAHELHSFREYLDLVESDPAAEAQAFVNALTTNLTSFFREGYHFGVLSEQLRATYHHEHGGRSEATPALSIWCCAASTGEEAYSLAITACETFNTLTPPVRILATDIDTSVLQTAVRGIYPLDRIDGLDEQRKRSFFQRGSGASSGQCRVRPEVQALVEFRPLNLLDRDYGLRRGAYSAVFCRNVMIYFDKPTQTHVLERIAPLLTASGRLYAGHSESFSHASHVVAPCGRTIYRAATPGERR